MKKSLYALLLLVLLIGSFMGGIRYSRTESSKSNEDRGGRKALYYVDPMNPSHTSDKPGVAPCGMALEPVYADEEGPENGAPETAAALVSSMPPGTVKISPQKQQIIGVQTGTVEKISEARSFRALGRVAPDENKVYRILAGSDGWIWDVQAGTTGSLVQKDQLLGTLYNYLFLARQQQYLYALDLADKRQQAQKLAAGTQAQTSPQSPQSSQPAGKPMEAQQTKHAGAAHHQESKESDQPQNYYVPLASYDMVQTNVGGINPAGGTYYINNPLELAKLELYNLGVGEYQMREIARTRQIAKDLDVRSPIDGIVLSRNVSPQQRFDKGTEIFRVADIGRVWIVTDIYSREARFIKPGMRARVSLPDHETVFDATVTNVPSQFDPTTRTLKIRLEADNPDYALRPDMFVDVQFEIELPVAIAVPADAVLDSGASKTVFVDLGNGYFEPRQVKTGWHSGNRIEIKEGLEPGERIVVSGNFLIDSESRMKMAVANLRGPVVKDPVCRTDVTLSKAKEMGLALEHEGATHGFCSQDCMEKYASEHGLDRSELAGQMSHQAAPSAQTAQSANSDGAAYAFHPGDPDHEHHGFAMDPVCGMPVRESQSKAAGLSGEFEGKTYFFCSKDCFHKFARAPDRFAQWASRRQAQQKYGAPEREVKSHD